MVKGVKLYNYWSNIIEQISHQGSFSFTEQLESPISENTALRTSKQRCKNHRVF